MSKAITPKSRASTPVRKKNAQVATWEEIESFLPDTMRTMQAPESSQPVTAPLVQGVLNGLANAAPSLHTAATGGQCFRVIGPPEALNGSLSHMLDKHGNILGGMLDDSGKIAVQKRFEDMSGALNGAAAAAAVFQVLSVVTAQYYLHQISTSLANIETKVNDIHRKLSNQQLGEIAGAIETIDEIYAANVRRVEQTGQLDWQAPDKIEFWTRISNAEQALRKNVVALEREIAQDITRIANKVRDGKERRKESFDEHRELLKELADWQESEAVINYLLALNGMLKWYQITLAFDSQTTGGMQNGRYEQMVKYVKERQAYFASLKHERVFIINRPDGTSWKDDMRTGGATLLTAITPVLGGVFTAASAGATVHHKRLQSFERDRNKAIEGIFRPDIPLIKVSSRFDSLVESFNAPSNFYLVSETEGDVRKLRMSVSGSRCRRPIAPTADPESGRRAVLG